MNYRVKIQNKQSCYHYNFLNKAKILNQRIKSMRLQMLLIELSISDLIIMKHTFQEVDVDHQKALSDLNKAIELDAQSSEGYYHRSICHIKQKDLIQHQMIAIVLFKSILISHQYMLGKVQPQGVCIVRKKHENIDQNCWQAYNNMGALLPDMNKNTLPLMDYNKSIEINPNGELAYNNRGILYKDTGKFDLSFKDFNKSIQLSQHSTLAYFNRGLLFLKLGKLEQGLQDFNKAIELDKANSHQRGTFIKMGKNQQACEDFQKALGNISGNNQKTGNQEQSQKHPIQEPQRFSEGSCCQIQLRLLLVQ